MSAMAAVGAFFEDPQVLFGLILLVAGSYWTYVINKIDKNQTALWTRLDGVCKQLDTLQGEHNFAVGKHFKKEE
jgi:hypothetical protein